MKNIILKVLNEYIKNNDLLVKISGVEKWYLIMLLIKETPHLYRLKIDVQEYKSSTVIYFKDKRYDFLNDKFEEEFTKLVYNLK